MYKVRNVPTKPLYRTGRCPVCWREIKLTGRGTAWPHTRSPYKREQGERRCPGSKQPAEAFSSTFVGDRT